MTQVYFVQRGGAQPCLVRTLQEARQLFPQATIVGAPDPATPVWSLSGDTLGTVTAVNLPAWLKEVPDA